MDWLNKISVTCFAASYLVVFGLEVSRVYFKAKLRPIARIGFAVAGLFAHTVYMLYQGNVEIGETGIWLSNWQAWCYATAWVLAAAYFWFSIQKSQSVVGLFVLPLVLLLIAVGIYHPGWVQTDMGGSAADITADVAAKGLATEFDRLALQTTGCFRTWDGRDHPY